MSNKDFFKAIAVKGMNTGLKKGSKPEAVEARKAELNRYVDGAIAPEVNGRYATASFEGSERDGQVPVYVTTIFPSGRYHCECPAFQRDGAHRQNRPCKHATALSKVAWMRS